MFFHDSSPPEICPFLHTLSRPDALPSCDGLFPIFVGEIRWANEALRPDWPVAGTTCYEALALVNGPFVDPAGEKPLTEAYTALTGEEASFARVEIGRAHV